MKNPKNEKVIFQLMKFSHDILFSLLLKIFDKFGTAIPQIKIKFFHKILCPKQQKKTLKKIFKSTKIFSGLKLKLFKRDLELLTC